MDKQRIVKELKVKYPGKKIICVPEDKPTEIIVELEPSIDHPERSLSVAVVGKSKFHYHKKSLEIYEAVKGELTVYIDGKKHILKEGERVTIKPGEKHYAAGDEVWFLTYSKPGGVFEDHIIVEGD